MAAQAGATWTGSMTFTTGQGGQDRWIYAGDQVARTLTIQASGPSLPTPGNIIKTDRGSFSGLALHVKTVKTVSGQSDITFDLREIYAWGGTDEDHHVRWSYDGANSFGAVYIQEGSGSGFDKAICQSNKFVIDSSAVNYETHTWIPMWGSTTSPLAIPFGIVGVHIHLSTGAGAITTTNTWTWEMTWCYWN